jgi:uncharacterized membrane protein HdeD (DUF308 family)
MKSDKLNLISEIVGVFLGSVLVVFSLTSLQLFWNTNPYFSKSHSYTLENWNPQSLITMYIAMVVISIFLFILGVLNYKSSGRKDMKSPAFWFILSGILGLVPFIGFIGGILAWVGARRSAKE